MDTAKFRKLISTRGQQGLIQRIYFIFLVFLSFFYRCGVGFRNFLYNWSLKRSYRSQAAVISVGNITTGGTGKTPLVAWVCNLLAEKGVDCAILTRGYKIDKTDFADEPAMLAKAAPHARVIVNPDRVAGAKKAVSEYNAKAIVLDDGFQHRRLSRDIDIVAIDATEPFGYGRVLPAGLGREPLKSLGRANAIVITRFNQSQKENTDKISAVLEKYAKSAPVAKAMHKPIKVKMTGNEQMSFDELRDKKVFAFCGIGNPQAFFQTLEELSLNIVGQKVYNDHHRYSHEDIAEIYEQSRYCKADVILTTEKDWTKTALLSMKKIDMPLGRVVVELEFVSGKDRIAGLIEETVRAKSEAKKDKA